MKLPQKLRLLMIRWLAPCEIKTCKRNGTEYREIYSKRYRPFGFKLMWMCRDCANYHDSSSAYTIAGHQNVVKETSVLPIRIPVRGRAG